jgi:hypothetical protein
MYPTITRPIRAKLERAELHERTDRRARIRRHLPSPVAAAVTIALALCEVEASNRSAAQLEPFFHHTLWAAASPRIRRSGGPVVTTQSLIRVVVQELTPGLVDAVVLVRRGARVAAITMRLDAAPGYWEVVELQY